MKTLLKGRLARIQLLTVLLGLALYAGVGTVGYAQDISSMVITAERPVHDGSALKLRDEMAATAEGAVWQTRLSVATSLGAKLTTQPGKLRIAGRNTDKRG